MMKEVTKSLKEVYKLAEDLVKQWSKLGLGQRATVIGLYGDLGSGKTSFVQGVAKALGVKENITSPTFVIEKIYNLRRCHLRRQRFNHLIHIDAYRLESSDELLHLGWNDIAKDPKNLILIEWADRIEKILPKNTQKIFFKFVDEEKREIVV